MTNRERKQLTEARRLMCELPKKLARLKRDQPMLVMKRRGIREQLARATKTANRLEQRASPSA